MSDDWKARFRELYQAAQQRYRDGRTTPETIFEADEADFLASLGCTSQELFDFVEDRTRVLAAVVVTLAVSSATVAIDSAFDVAYEMMLFGQEALVAFAIS